MTDDEYFEYTHGYNHSGEHTLLGRERVSGENAGPWLEIATFHRQIDLISLLEFLDNANGAVVRY